MRKRKFTKQAGVLFDDDFYNLLIEITDQQEIPVSEFIRTIVENELQKLRKENNDDDGSSS